MAPRRYRGCAVRWPHGRAVLLDGWELRSGRISAASHPACGGLLRQLEVARRRGPCAPRQVLAPHSVLASGRRPYPLCAARPVRARHACQPARLQQRGAQRPSTRQVEQSSAAWRRFPAPQWSAAWARHALPSRGLSAHSVQRRRVPSVLPARRPQRVSTRQELLRVNRPAARARLAPPFSSPLVPSPPGAPEGQALVAPFAHRPLARSLGADPAQGPPEMWLPERLAVHSPRLVVAPVRALLALRLALNVRASDDRSACCRVASPGRPCPRARAGQRRVPCVPRLDVSTSLPVVSLAMARSPRCSSARRAARQAQPRPVPERRRCFARERCSSAPACWR